MERKKLKKKTIVQSYRLSNNTNPWMYLLYGISVLAIFNLFVGLRISVLAGIITSFVLWIKDQFLPGQFVRYVEMIKYPKILFGNHKNREEKND